MGRGITIALAVSLGLNFFLAGYLVKDRLSPPPPSASGEFKGFDHPHGLARMAEALPPETRSAFRDSFKAQLPNMRAHYRETRELRDDVRALMEKDEWDSVAVAAKLEEIRAMRARQQQDFDRAFLNAVGGLSAQERQLMVDLAQQRRKEWRDKKRERRRDRKKPPPQN